MDSLFFNTKNRDALFKELGIPEDFQGRIYESPDDWVLEWLGKIPAEMGTETDETGIEYQVVTKWQEGDFFNIYLKGQDNMDFFTQTLVFATQINEPDTPNSTLI